MTKVLTSAERAFDSAETNVYDINLKVLTHALELTYWKGRLKLAKDEYIKARREVDAERLGA